MGRPDGRSFGAKVRRLNPTLQPVAEVVRLFLWHRYQYDAEGLPDRFTFETLPKTTLVKSGSLGMNKRHFVVCI